MVTRLWAARQVEENRSEVAARAVALLIEMRGAFREEWAARKGQEAVESGGENTRTAAKAATNAHLVPEAQEATRQATVPLLLLPPGCMVGSPVIPPSQTLTCISRSCSPDRRPGEPGDRG